MLLPADSPALIEFRCNLCGAPNQLESTAFHREVAVCCGCGSNARFRGIIGALGEWVGETGDRPLAGWPERRALRGIGMSDWPGYANLLAAKFDYVNSFYDREPQLDIQALRAEQVGCYDFVISSDVFEHVAPPLDTAFANLMALLKPGGQLIFSVPHTRVAQTVEHFPGLHDFAIVDLRGGKVLVNRDAAGGLQAYQGLIFHGGEGATLEMRVYCERDVLARLAQAEFVDIRVHDQPKLDIGYYWPPLDSGKPEAPFHAYIITATRPGGAA